jgi:hypothetical protein
LARLPVHRHSAREIFDCGANVADSGSGKLNLEGGKIVIRTPSSGKYRLYSRKTDPHTGKRRNLGTFNNRSAAEKHERAVQYFKHHA